MTIVVDINPARVPIKIRELRQFRAADPWQGEAATAWTLSLFRMVPKAYAVGASQKEAKRQQTPRRPGDDPGPQGRALARDEAIGLETAGAHPRLLPRLLFDRFGLILFARLLIADVLYVVPSLVDDLGSRGALRTAPQATLDAGAACRRRSFVILCNFEVTFRTEGGAAAVKHRAFHYLMFFEKIDNRLPLQVYYDPANPQRASTSWGRALLVNRLLTEGAALVLCWRCCHGTP